MKTSILSLVVSVLLFNASRAAEPTYHRIYPDDLNPIRGIVLTKDQHPLRLKNENVFALFNTTVRVDERKSLEDSFTDQSISIAQSVTRLGINKEGKIQLTVRDQPKSNRAIVYLKVAVANQGQVLECVTDVRHGSQFRVYQDDEESSRTRERITKTVIFEHLNNYQLPTELYIVCQPVAQEAVAHEINTKQFVLGKKEEAAAFYLFERNNADDK